MSNRVDAVISPTAVTSIMTALAGIRTNLAMLQTLTDAERLTLAKMGDKTQAFVKQALDTATRHPEILPGAFSLEDFQTDVALIDSLRPIWGEVRELFNALDDTMLLAGSEAFAAALEVYQYAKVNDKDGELTDALKDMGQRFSRKPYKKDIDPKPAES
jgi:hypothetical protein